jgi:hypothetical protein
MKKGQRRRITAFGQNIDRKGQRRRTTAFALAKTELFMPSDLGREYVHTGKHPVFARILLKLHNPVNGGENGEIPAQTDTLAGMHTRTELTHDDIAGQNTLPSETLYTPALARAIATVAGTSACFFMCHRSISSLQADMEVISRVE